MRARIVPWLLAGLLAVILGGCRERHEELLVVVSGDCQAYLEPCG